jgi:hypothetical protein
LCAAGETEHQALIARAAGVDAYRNIGRLRLNQVVYAAGVAIEAIRGIVIAHILDGSTSDARHIHVRGGRDFTRDNTGASGHQHLAGHAARGVVRQHRIQHRVRDLVGDLVGMPFRNGFRRENMGVIICQNCLLSYRGVSLKPFEKLPSMQCTMRAVCAGQNPVPARA